MTKHSSDINPSILNISYQQLSFYLKANDWIHEKTLDGFDIYSKTSGSRSCKVLLSRDDQSEDYKHNLFNILLILQELQTPSLEDINWQIKKFCLDFVTQEQIHE